MKRAILTTVVPILFYLLALWIGTYVIMYKMGIMALGIYTFYPLENLVLAVRFGDIDFFWDTTFLTFIAGGALGAMVIRTIFTRINFTSKERQTVQGSSRWAKDREIRAMGLRKKHTGVVLGHYGSAQDVFNYDSSFNVDEYKEQKLMTYNGDSHAVVVGGTGSGKGISVIMPTMFSWGESIIVLDPKGELAEHTLKYRSEFSDCYIFSPDNTDLSCSYNPLREVRKGRRLYDDLGVLSYKVLPDDGSKEKVWINGARRLWQTIAFYVMTHFPEERQNLTEIATFLNSYHGQKVPEGYLPELAALGLITKAKYPWRYRKAGKMVKGNAQSFIGLIQSAPPTWSGQKSNFDTGLKVWVSPILSEITTKSDFAITDFVMNKRPITLYLVFNDEDRTNYEKLIRLFFTQFTSVLLRKQRKIRNKTLMLIDEFYQLGKMEEIEKAIPVVRSYGVRYLLVIQSIDQIKQLYGGDSSILDNCQIKVILQVTNDTTAEMVSKMLGNRTVEIENRSESVGGKGSISHSETAMKRRLMEAEEVRGMSLNNIIILGGKFPIFGNKIIYFLDKRFKAIWQEDDIDTLGEYTANITTPNLSKMAERGKSLMGIEKAENLEVEELPEQEALMQQAKKPNPPKKASVRPPQKTTAKQKPKVSSEPKKPEAPPEEEAIKDSADVEDIDDIAIPEDIPDEYMYESAGGLYDDEEESIEELVDEDEMEALRR